MAKIATHDFVGNRFSVGSYAASTGYGNSKAEYGAILYKIVELGEKFKVMRLAVRYDDKQQPVILAQTTWISNPNKYAVVSPSAECLELFERALEDASTLTHAEKVKIAHWIHGTERHVNLFAPTGV